MAWFGIQDFVKKRACRYILQHYLGQFLKEKLSLDQLSIDLYNGTGKILDLNLDIEALNADLDKFSVPVEIEDGFIHCISMSVPWSSLVHKSTEVEIKGLELTLRPKQRQDNSTTLEEMFSSMSMTCSLKLAQDCLEQEKATRGQQDEESQPIEGVQKFANLIDSVLSKIKVSFLDTVVRLEHLPIGSDRGVALEIRIKRVEYFDDMAMMEGTSVDGAELNVWEPSAFAHKNLYMEGVQLYFDEFSNRKFPSRSDSNGSSSQMYNSVIGELPGDPVDQDKLSRSTDTLQDHLESEPIQMASFTGRQELKIKIKQNDSLQGPKLDISCQFGAFHVFLCPRQLHGLLELVRGLASPVTSDPSHGYHRGAKSRPMDPMDHQLVEMQLQQHLQTGRIQSHKSPQVDVTMDSLDEDDQYFSLTSITKAGTDMESSISSNYSTSTNTTRTSSLGQTAGQSAGKKNSPKSHKDSSGASRFHEDPSAELTHYHLRISFFSVTLLHDNPVSGTVPKFAPATQSPSMQDMSKRYFQRVGGVSIAGMVELPEVRKKYAELVSVDHLRLIGKPLNVECHQKTALKQISLTLHLTVGILELVETLYNQQGTSKVPEFSQILVFEHQDGDKRQPSLYSSMHGGTPCLSLDVKNMEHTRPSSRPGGIPRTDVNLCLGDFQSEVDVTLIDRLNTVLTLENITNISAPGNSIYPAGGSCYYSISTTLDEGPASHDRKVNLDISCKSAKLLLRFPVPDLREVPHIDKSWWHRNLREEVLILELDAATFLTSFTTSQSIQELEVRANEVQAYFQLSCSEEARKFADAGGDGSEDGFNMPRLSVKFCQKTQSVLEEETFSDDSTPGDSLNGACQFARKEPSPFSSKKSMYGKEEESDKSETETVSEEMVLPADKDEMKQFQDKALINTQMIVEITLPNVCLFLPDKHFYEVLYNRLNNDLLLWEPIAPSPVTSHEQFGMSHHLADLSVYPQFLSGDHFEMARSALQYDSDSDSESQIYSIHDSKYPRRKRQHRQQQSKLCLSLGIGRGRVTAITDCKDVKGGIMVDSHGELLGNVEDLCLFTVANHGGDPNLQYLCVMANKAEIYHNGCVPNGVPAPIIDCGELTAPIPPHLEGYKIIYMSDSGMLGSTVEDGEAPDVLTVAVKIRQDILATTRDLSRSEQRIKEFTVSLGVCGATMRHRMSPPYQNFFSQIIDLLDVKDYPVLGYQEPKVLTELHVHLWTCAIDYRPLRIPVKAVITLESFSISSNIVTESSTSLLRFVLEDGALFLSQKPDSKEVSLRKDYVCVADLERLELLLRMSDDKDQKFPKRDLRVMSNRFNLRTCADSCQALINLIRYIADDSDLQPSSMSDTQPDVDTQIKQIMNSDEDRDQREVTPLSESKMDHVHSLMSEAMRESSGSAASTEETAEPRPVQSHKIYFYPEDEDAPASVAPGAGLRPIVISQSMDSVTSSTLSERTAILSEEEDEDDFCIIDDPAWSKAPKDGEPVIRVFINSPVEIKENFYAKPLGRTDLLKAPETFPPAEYRYTLKELTLVWYMYGGSDFDGSKHHGTQPKAEVVTAEHLGEKEFSMAFHRGSPQSGGRWSVLTAGATLPPLSPEKLKTLGGAGRNQNVCLELLLSKVRLQHETYPSNTEQASRQILLIHDVELRDRLKSSKINKFLYQYSSEDMPRQTYANMVMIKLLHRRPDPSIPEQECSLKVSLLPLRLNIDQDSAFFLKTFLTGLSQDEESTETTELPTTNPSESDPSSSPQSLRSIPQSLPPPIMKVNKDPQSPDEPSPQDLLMQFDELQASLGATSNITSSTHSNQSVHSTMSTDSRSSQPVFFKGRLVSESPSKRVSTVSTTSNITSSTHSNQPVHSTVSTDSRSSQSVFFKSFIFSPDVPIRLDFHGKFAREHGTIGGLGGLVSLNHSELKLKRLNYKQGLLGPDKVFMYAVSEWLSDIKANQLPHILGGVGPMHSFVLLAQGIKDLFWLPVEQYRKDGRIIRGLQRGATSFTTSTAMSLLELTNRVVQGVQWFAELTFDMVSSGARKRRGYRPRQPSDLREGVSNAYNVIKEGFTDTAQNIVEVATKEHEQKGMMGAVGGVLRQIPPTIVQPLIIGTEATSNVLGGMRSQLKPESKKEDEEKWKDEMVD